MWKNELTLRIGGESGEGMVTTGEIFSRIAAHSGLEVHTFRTYPAEILGGHVMFQLRAGKEHPYSHGDELDVLLAFNEEAYQKHYGELRKDGVLIYDPRALTLEEKEHEGYSYALPFSELSEKIHYIRGKNIIAVGCLVALFGLPMEKAEDVIKQRLARKGEEALVKNLEALHTGYKYVKENIVKKDPFHLEEIKIEKENRLVLQGNMAIALGALEAGCRFYAGYPITPASDLMETLAELLPRVGGIMIQAEDEIAAISMVMGASYAGKKAMTATSGPGLSLMAEVLGLSSMIEVPVVIVDVQRGGPSTGLPTKTSQDDLFFALYGGHGEAPRIVLAPLTVEDAFYQIIHAFNLSERYQLPCIFLSDQFLSHRVETIPALPFGKVEKYSRLLPPPESNAYRRFEITESGISPMSLPGMIGKQYTAESLEHNEQGNPDYDPANHMRMTQKRFRKLETLREREIEKLKLYEEEGSKDAEIGVLTWGSSYGPALEAVRQAQEQGIKVALFAPRILSPLPEDQIQAFAKNKKHLIVPEVNFQGQFATLLRALLLREVEPVNTYGGMPFTRRPIFEKICQCAEAKRKPIKEAIKV